MSGEHTYWEKDKTKQNKTKQTNKKPSQIWISDHPLSTPLKIHCLEVAGHQIKSISGILFIFLYFSFKFLLSLAHAQNSYYIHHIRIWQFNPMRTTCRLVNWNVVSIIEPIRESERKNSLMYKFVMLDCQSLVQIGLTIEHFMTLTN